MNSKCLSIPILVLLSMASRSPVFAGIPQVISYQGMITDNGAPVSDGSYSMRFRIYDAVTAGNMEWDSGTVSVSLSGGVFSILLGESPQPALDLAFDEDYWLLTTFAGTNQAPRQRIGSVGYAYMAGGLVPGTEVVGEVTSGTKAAIKGTNTAISAVSYGVHGVTNSMIGRGVFGLASSSTGLTFGVWGESQSTSARGVYGTAPSTTGNTFGVYGITSSSQGYGVYGWAPAIGVSGYANNSTGSTAGVYGECGSSEGYGVHGYALNTQGSPYGVYGHVVATDGKGVVGKNLNTTGYADGVLGQSSSPYGNAVCGYNYATTGSAIGVGGTTFSTQGRAVYGYASNGEGMNYGIFGLTFSSAGCGVFGSASATSGVCYGVYGTCYSSNGYGIYGDNGGGGIAGRFDGDVEINGRMELPDVDATPSQGSGSLEIGNALRIDGNEIITNTDGLLHLQRDNNGDLKVDEGTLMVDASLNRVGIGTSTPEEALTVYGRVYVSNMDGTSSGYTVRWYDNRLYYLVSSEKYKTNIEVLDEEFDTILKAVPKSFIDRTSGEQSIGFIAEELHDLGLGNLVQYRDGEPEAVKYELVSLYLLEVIRGLKKENTRLDARITALETSPQIATR